MNLNSSPSPFPMHQVLHDNDSHFYHHPFAPTAKPSPSSSPTCHFFFDSTRDHDAGSFYDHPHRTFYRPLEDSYDYEGGSRYDHEIKSKVDSSLKLTLWKKEDDESSSIPMKWMSSKMRVMQKMKSPDGTAASSSDQKLQLSPSSETDMSCNTPIMVCSDCHTTKTPLWRSGPKGPKSLCNACGIRQRKARRAAAAAAAANVAGDHPPVVKIKVQQQREKSAAAGKIGHSSHLKKRCKTAAGATSAVGSVSNAQKKIGFEDFLINISKNLSFHRVFPEDEKDAAILLMALSSGLVNG